MSKKKKDFRKWSLAYVKKAIVDYQMISHGDGVAVGLSGGKDSGVLLYALWAIRRIAPIDFNIHAIFLDLGFGMDVEPLRQYCRRLEIPFHLLRTDIGEIVFDVRNEKNPCALCANLRRGALNGFALELGCRKVALGHHLDDVVETFFMSLFYNGQFRTFEPNTYLDRRDIYMIRPLVYLEQETVRELSVLEKVPIIENPCPVSGHTKREEIKLLVRELMIKYPDLRQRMLTALHTADLKNLWPLPPGRREKEV